MRGLRFPSSEFTRRIRRIRKRMSDRGLDALAVFSTPGSMRYGQRGHVLYISGYEPYFGDSMVLLPAESDVEPLLQIDSADYFPNDCTWIETVVGAKDPLITLKEFVAGTKPAMRRIGLVGECSASAGFRTQLNGRLGSCEIVEASDILESERAVKSEFEIESIKNASGIAKVGFEKALECAAPGITEAEIVAEVEKACRLEGSEGFPHHTMVTSGKDRRHLEWWWYCGRRKLRKADPWNLDFGTMSSAYCCDIARSYCLGRPSDHHVSLYERLVEAEDVAAEAMVPDATASEVNRVVSEKMGETFKGDFSGIGHGVGLEVHEWPFIGYEYIENNRVYADSKLKKNMVVSVEPQVFVKGLGYMQVEDEFVVTKAGGKPLSAIPRQLWH